MLRLSRPSLNGHSFIRPIEWNAERFDQTQRDWLLPTHWEIGLKAYFPVLVGGAIHVCAESSNCHCLKFSVER